MGKKLIYAFLILLLVLLTIFGLGPVLLADGTDTERMRTLVIVIVIYLAVFLSFYLVHRFTNK